MKGQGVSTSWVQGLRKFKRQCIKPHRRHERVIRGHQAEAARGNLCVQASKRQRGAGVCAATSAMARLVDALGVEVCAAKRGEACEQACWWIMCVYTCAVEWQRVLSAV